MGRSPCCEKVGLKKGPWTPEEDQKLLAYIEQHGHGSWRALPAKAGLQRCGKSCRLRWTNYLRPDIKRGKFSLQEEQTIIQLHALLGNRWSAIAAHLPKRTDNEIKNYWNTHLKKRLTKMGIDPMTHKPKINPFGSGHSKDAANLSHMAQWESARLEAEARLVRESKHVPNPYTTSQLSSSLGSAAYQLLLNKPNDPLALKVPPSLDVLKAWQEAWSRPRTRDLRVSSNADDMFGSGESLNQSPSTYALNFSDQDLVAFPTVGFGENPCYLENPYMHESGIIKGGLMHETLVSLKENQTSSKSLGNSNTASDDIMQLHDNNAEYPNGSGSVMDPLSGLPSFIQGFTELLPENLNAQCSTGYLDNVVGNCGMADMEDSKNYWNSILNLVASPVGSPVF